jgi:hypothetical protein
MLEIFPQLGCQNGIAIRPVADVLKEMKAAPVRIAGRAKIKILLFCNGLPDMN